MASAPIFLLLFSVVLVLVQANADHLWHVHCNGILEKQKSECQKAILEVPMETFWNMVQEYETWTIILPSKIYNFYLWKLSINPKK